MTGVRGPVSVSSTALWVIGTGVALAGLIVSQSSGTRSLVNNRIDSFESVVSARMQAVNISVGAVDTRVDDLHTLVNSRVDGLETLVSSRVDGLEALLNSRVDGLETLVSSRVDGTSETPAATPPPTDYERLLELCLADLQERQRQWYSMALDRLRRNHGAGWFDFGGRDAPPPPPTSLPPSCRFGQIGAVEPAPESDDR